MSIDKNGVIEEIIVRLKKYKSIGRPLPHGLVSKLGKKCVLDKLNGLGFKKLTPDKRKANIYIDYNGKKINVKIRTSTLKNEGLYPKDVKYWGWTVKEWDKQEIEYDILVGVALNDDFVGAQFYIFTREEALLIDDIRIKRFKNVQNKIHLFESEEAYRKAIEKPKIVTKYERYINENKSEFLCKWAKIR
ncbi:MAG: hypothetical protein BME93_04080 [Methanosarcinales archaeon Met12]|nr:MAG: hypothetical protein BME93_04080 [Methanosarcinales archaeon Met12]